MKVSFDGATECSARKSGFIVRLIVGLPSEPSVEIVFCRQISICQAMPCSLREPTRLRARSSPETVWVGIEMPASRISCPSLGDMKYGTFSARRSDRSERCNGQNGSEDFSQFVNLARKSA